MWVMPSWNWLKNYDQGKNSIVKLDAVLLNFSVRPTPLLTCIMVHINA